MAAFNLTANINARLNTANVRAIANQLRNQLSIDAKVNLVVPSATSNNISSLTKSFKVFNRELIEVTKNSKNVQTALNSLASAFQNVNNQLATNVKTQKALNNLNNLGNAAKNATNQMEQFGKQAGLAFRRFAGFTVATGAIGGLIASFTSAVREAISFQDQLVRISQVSRKSLSSLSGLAKEISRLSITLGVSSNSLLEVSQILVQAGLSARDTQIALEALAKTSLAPTFGDIKETTEGAIAVLAQFGLKAKDLEKALSSINAVSAAFAVESDDIIAAVKRSGAAFAATSEGVVSGIDALNQFIAVFTSVRATTRESAETISTGLRTIFTRIQRPETIQFLKTLGINLQDLEGKFVGPFEAVTRLSEGLARLDARDPLFASVVEELGGFRQVGKVIPLLAQQQLRLRALAVAQASYNSLTEDAAIAQQSWLVQITKVKEEFITLIREISETETFKAIINLTLDMARAFIQVADSIKPIIPLLAAFGAVKGTQALFAFSKGLFGKGGIRFHDGGYVGRQRYASGGDVRARGLVPGGKGNVDDYPATLQEGEFVIRRKAVDAIGKGNLDKMNKSGRLGFNGGGEVYGPYSLKLASLNEQDKDEFDKISEPGLIDVLVGTSNNFLPEADVQEAKALQALKGSNYQGIMGSLFEAVLNLTNDHKLFNPEQDPNRPFDFDKGFSGNLAEKFEQLKGINYIDAKYSKQAASRKADMRKKIINQAALEKKNKKVSGGILTKKEIGAAIFTPFLPSNQQPLTIDQFTQADVDKKYNRLIGLKTPGDGEEGKTTTRKGRKPSEEKVAAAKFLNSLIGKTSITPEEEKEADKALIAYGIGSGKIRGNIISNLAIRKKTFNSGGKVPALLTRGEYVINRNAARSIGYGNLNKLNYADKYNLGGIVRNRHNLGGIVRQRYGFGSLVTRGLKKLDPRRRARLQSAQTLREYKASPQAAENAMTPAARMFRASNTSTSSTSIDDQIQVRSRGISGSADGQTNAILQKIEDNTSKTANNTNTGQGGDAGGNFGLISEAIEQFKKGSAGGGLKGFGKGVKGALKVGAKGLSGFGGLGIGIAGQALGDFVGGKTGGAISGATSGAAIGAQFAGPYGAAAGALIGGAGGFLGAAQEQRVQAQRVKSEQAQKASDQIQETGLKDFEKTGDIKNLNAIFKSLGNSTEELLKLKQEESKSLLSVIPGYDKAKNAILSLVDGVAGTSFNKFSNQENRETGQLLKERTAPAAEVATKAIAEKIARGQTLNQATKGIDQDTKRALVLQYGGANAEREIGRIRNERVKAQSLGNAGKVAELDQEEARIIESNYKSVAAARLQEEAAIKKQELSMQALLIQISRMDSALDTLGDSLDKSSNAGQEFAKKNAALLSGDLISSARDTDFSARGISNKERGEAARSLLRDRGVNPNNPGINSLLSIADNASTAMVAVPDILRGIAQRPGILGGKDDVKANTIANRIISDERLQGLPDFVREEINSKIQSGLSEAGQNRQAGQTLPEYLSSGQAEKDTEEVFKKYLATFEKLNAAQNRAITTYETSLDQFAALQDKANQEFDKQQQMRISSENALTETYRPLTDEEKFRGTRISREQLALRAGVTNPGFGIGASYTGPIPITNDVRAIQERRAVIKKQASEVTEAQKTASGTEAAALSEQAKLLQQQDKAALALLQDIANNTQAADAALQKIRSIEEAKKTVASSLRSALEGGPEALAQLEEDARNASYEDAGVSLSGEQLASAARGQQRRFDVMRATGQTNMTQEQFEAKRDNRLLQRADAQGIASILGVNNLGSLTQGTPNEAQRIAERQYGQATGLQLEAQGALGDAEQERANTFLEDARRQYAEQQKAINESLANFENNFRQGVDDMGKHAENFPKSIEINFSAPIDVNVAGLDGLRNTEEGLRTIITEMLDYELRRRLTPEQNMEGGSSPRPAGRPTTPQGRAR